MSDVIVLEGREMGDDAAAVYRSVQAQIQAFNDSLGSAFKQLNDRFDTEKESWRAQVAGQLEAQERLWEIQKSEMDAIHQKLYDEFSNRAADVVSQIKMGQGGFQTMMEYKINQANESLAHAVPKAVGDYFADQKIFLLEMQKEVQQFHEDIIAQNSKFTVDAQARVSIVQAKLDTVLGQLRSVLKDL